MPVIAKVTVRFATRDGPVAMAQALDEGRAARASIALSRSDPRQIVSRACSFDDAANQTGRPS